MKKIFAIISVIGLLAVGTATYAAIADEPAAPAAQEQTAVANQPASLDAEKEATLGGQPMHQALKQKFIEGGVAWMSPVMLCLILGLAIVIERIITLNLSATNKEKFVEKVNEALKSGGVEAAKDLCRNTRGPIASIFYQGLLRIDSGYENAERAVVAYGSVKAGELSSGMSWIALFIAASPMLGFMGTIVGMIQAFDSIEAMGDIAPAVVAGGIKVALLTTIAGLISAVILQIFYNYLLAKIDSLTVDMEDASISLMDMLCEKNA